jgi:two-component system NarL family sensor kinase
VVTLAPAWEGWIQLGAGSLILAGGVAALLMRWRRDRPARPFPARLVGLLLAAASAGLLSVLLRLMIGPGSAPDRLWTCAAFILLPTALALYPDDRPPKGLGWTSVSVVALSGAICVASPAAHVNVFLAGGFQYLLVFAIQGWRYEDTDHRGQHALLWLALGAVPGPVTAPIAGFAAENAGAAVSAIAWVVFVACLVVGLSVPDLWDVRALILTLVVQLVAGLVVVVTFATTLSTIRLAAGHPVDLSPGTLGLIAAGCALGYSPTARLLRVVIELLLFGVRIDPIQAVSRAGERLSDDPVPALRSLRESLNLPYAALLDGSGRAVAASGRRPESVSRHPVSATDPTLGHLEVGLRLGQQTLQRSDQQVLTVLASALAQLMHARALRTQLQASRAAVVTAIEEERRRLLRDLHDGLGPRLTGVAFKADAARNVLNRDAVRASDLLASLRGDVGEAIHEVRRLVEGLRPPSLDQVGLEQALLQHARHVLRADGQPLAVDLSIPTPLPELGAAVEVTAYRIVVEALTNAARHSLGDHVVVILRVEGEALAVEIRDNGRYNGPWSPGIGLTSMHERTEMLGGTVIAQGGTTGGMVLARLPLASGSEG